MQNKSFTYSEYETFLVYDKDVPFRSIYIDLLCIYLFWQLFPTMTAFLPFFCFYLSISLRDFIVFSIFLFSHLFVNFFIVFFFLCIPIIFLELNQYSFLLFFFVFFPLFVVFPNDCAEKPLLKTC